MFGEQTIFEGQLLSIHEGAASEYPNWEGQWEDGVEWR